jgi:hypothetical protein
MQQMEAALSHKPAFSRSSSTMESFKVLFVGAGAINFGTPRAPWNHSARLEKFDPFIPAIDLDSLVQN